MRLETIQDIGAVSELCRHHGVVFHCDGAQAPCGVDLSTIARVVDLLSLSAHKMYGPKGVGALYIRRELQDDIEPLIYGRGQQNNLRSGTMPTPLCVGMGAAAAVIADEGAAERDRVAGLRDQFIEGLSSAAHLNGPAGGKRHPGNASLRFEGFDAPDILGALQPHLAASTGSACTTGIPERSHVLRAIGLSDREAAASIRFSFGRASTEANAEEAIFAIRAALSELSGHDAMQIA